MKKTVLRIFSLILIALITCTILSLKIEDEMLLEVIPWRVSARYDYVYVPNDMYLEDADGNPRLFEVAEGTGWESGWRAREVEVRGGIFLTDKEYFIARGASRLPSHGDLAEIYDGNEVAPSTYLCIYPNGVPEYEERLLLVDILDKSDTALIVHVEDGPQPFMENRAKGGMIQISTNNWSVYEFEAIEAFLRDVPLAAAIFVVLLFLTVLCIYTLILSIRAERNKRFLWINGILIALTMLSLPFFLSTFDFPSAMMPSLSIFDWDHYRAVFDEILPALDTLGPDARALVPLRAQVAMDVVTLLFFGALIPFVLITLEHLILGRKRKR